MPVRGVAATFAATLYATVPLPVDVDGDVMVTQESLLTALHGHSVSAVTETEPDPAADVKDRPGSDRL